MDKIVSQNFADYATMSGADVLAALQSTHDGLSEAEVRARQLLFGLNKIPEHLPSRWQIFTRQFFSPFILLLIFISILLIVFLQDRIDGYIILVIVSINTFVGFYQEYKAQEGLLVLREYLQLFVRVRRDGIAKEVKTEELVPGDIVLLQTGDVIPADIRIIQSTHVVTIDESSLTGESDFVSKSAQPRSQEKPTIFTAETICFAGTFVSTGTITGVVIATGVHTTTGTVVSLSLQNIKASNLQKDLASFTQFILYKIIIVIGLIFVAHLLVTNGHTDYLSLFIFSIALAVSIIPESLPIITTFALTRGALTLLKRKVVVKRLAAIQDLGSIELLCVDKTGTLTENILTVSSTYPENNREVIVRAALVYEGEVFAAKTSKSFDAALQARLNVEEKKEIQTYKKIDEISFDAVRRRNAVILRKNGTDTLLVRGSFLEVAALCSSLDNDAYKKMLDWVHEAEKKGNRVLAVATKIIKSDEIAMDHNLLTQEHSLRCVGLIAFEDPIKKTAADAISNAKKLGVAIKVISGDSTAVCTTVAKELGLITDESLVISGAEWDACDDQAQHELAQRCVVFSRMAPQQKYEIVRLLSQNCVVGYLGDGINDVPPLKAASVSIVVQGADDIVQDASDIILLQKSLNVIIGGITEGRIILDNILKYIKITLASNFGNFYALAIVSLFSSYWPLLPAQILFLDLLSDFPMLSIATDSVDHAELSHPKRFNIKDIALFTMILGIISTFFDLTYFYIYRFVQPAVFQTNWFLLSVISEVVLIFSLRTSGVFYKAKRPSELLLGLSCAVIMIALGLSLTPVGHRLFGFTAPSLYDFFIIGILVVFYFIATEIIKHAYGYYVRINQEIN